MEDYLDYLEVKVSKVTWKCPRCGWKTKKDTKDANGNIVFRKCLNCPWSLKYDSR